MSLNIFVGWLAKFYLSEPSQRIGGRIYYSFLPLYLDATNPSTNMGWNESERKGLKLRLKFDALIALAIEHHLAVSKNIPLDQTIDWLVSFAPKGLIEFVPKQDETVQLSHQNLIFAQFTQENQVDFH